MHIDYIGLIKQLSHAIFFLSISVLLSSCGRDLYVPNPSNLLVLESKKDFKTSVGINSAQVAYSPIEKLGIKGDFGYVRGNNTFGRRNFNVGTLGLGYYNAKEIKPLFSELGKSMRRPQTPSIGFDIFANVSLGRISTINTRAFSATATPTSTGFPNRFQANIYKPNLSAQVCWKSKIFTVNLGVRYSHINFFNGLAFGEFDPVELEIASNLIDLSPKSNIEYDLKFSTGSKDIASFLSISWNQRNMLFRTINSTFSFGVDINISGIISNKFRKEKVEIEKSSTKK